MTIHRIQPNVNFKGLMVFTKNEALNTDYIESMEPQKNSLGIKFCHFVMSSGEHHRCELPEGVTMNDVYKAYALAARSKTAVEYLVPEK